MLLFTLYVCVRACVRACDLLSKMCKYIYNYLKCKLFKHCPRYLQMYAHNMQMILASDTNVSDNKIIIKKIMFISHFKITHAIHMLHEKCYQIIYFYWSQHIRIPLPYCILEIYCIYTLKWVKNTKISTILLCTFLVSIWTFDQWRALTLQFTAHPLWSTWVLQVACKITAKHIYTGFNQKPHKSTYKFIICDQSTI